MADELLVGKTFDSGFLFADLPKESDGIHRTLLSDRDANVTMVLWQDSTFPCLQIYTPGTHSSAFIYLHALVVVCACVRSSPDFARHRHARQHRRGAHVAPHQRVQHEQLQSPPAWCLHSWLQGLLRHLPPVDPPRWCCPMITIQLRSILALGVFKSVVVDDWQGAGGWRWCLRARRAVAGASRHTSLALSFECVPPAFASVPRLPWVR
jgi:hypothetical protein